jgi:glycosyltransferase involved in cell wall biosynthesis
MKILFVSEVYPPNQLAGGAISTHEMADEIGKTEEALVLTPQYNNPIQHEVLRNHRVIRYPNKFVPKGTMLQQKFLFFAEMTKHLASLARDFKPDIIHSQNMMSLPAVSRVAEMHKAIGVAHVRDHRFECFTSRLGCISHSDATLLDFARCIGRKYAVIYPYSKLVTRAIRKALERCGKAFTVSSYLKDELLNHVNVHDVRTSYIGVNLETLKRIPPACDVEYPPADQENTLFYAGGLSSHKGIFELLNGFSMSCKKLKNAVLLIAGDGPNRGAVRELIRSRNLDRNVRLLGPLSHERTIAFMKLARLHVVPSLVPEAGSRATVESLACGIPVLGSDRGALPEIIKDAGEVVSPTPENIGSAITDLLSNHEKLNTMQARATHRGAQFSITRTCSEILDAYHEWLNQSNWSG